MLISDQGRLSVAPHMVTFRGTKRFGETLSPLHTKDHGDYDQA
jgi:hypothetical protein